MKRKILFFVAAIIFLVTSCEKDNIEPEFNHVTLLTEIAQVSYGDKPDFEISYKNNNVENGEISLQLLDEAGTRLAFLPNATLINETGTINVNDVPYLIEGKSYFFKIENYNYDSDYYQFNTAEDDTYEEKVLLEFKAHIKDGVMFPTIETFDLNVADDLGLQKSIIYDGKIYGGSIMLNNVSIFVNVKNRYPWNIFERVVLRNEENGLVIRERYIQSENYWVTHNDSLFELKALYLGNYNIEPDYFRHQIDFEIQNCIDTTEMLVNIKGYYYNGDYESFETKVDTIKIKQFK